MSRLLRSWKLKLVLAVSLSLTAVSLFALPAANAANPTTISFQGKVVNANGTNVTNGSYQFVFKLYTVSSGGSAIWTETDTGVTVTNGVFQVNLGATCPLFTANACNGSTPISFYTDSSLYLGITFNSDADGEMTPRVQFQSVPYASNADYVDGLSSSGLVQLGQSSSAQTDSSTNSSIFINKTGSSGDIIELQKSGSDVFDVTNAGAITDTSTYNSNTFTSSSLAFGASSAATIQAASGQNLTIGSSTSGILTSQASTIQESLGTGTASVQSVTTNNVDAFDVSDTSNIPIFQVDTTDPDLMSNPGFEAGITGWSASGSSSLAQNTNKGYVYNGQDSLAVTLNAASEGAIGTTTGTEASGGTFNFSFYAMGSAAITLNSPTVGGSACTLNATAVTTTGFQRYFCSVTGTASSFTSITITSSSTSGILYIDSVQLTSGSTTLNPYDIGAIQLRGVVDTPVSIESTSNSTTALQVLNSSSAQLFIVDSYDNLVQIGSSTSTTSQVNLALGRYSTYADTGTCGTSASSPAGALYYNTDTNAIRACINNGWEDIATTAGLGILLYGVVPDSGTVPGDLESTSTAGVTGPCKVSWASATTVNIQACSVYSGGRKITQAAVTVTLPGMTANQFTHLCYYSGGAAAGPITNSTAWFTAASTTETANLPTFSANNPVVCLATIKNNATTANTISQIFDSRVYTNSNKQFTNTAVASAPGWLMITSTTNTTEVTTTTTAATSGIAGVIAAGSAAAWASGGPNAILVTGGPVEIETTAGATTAYNYIETTSTAGYATTVTAPTATFALPNKYIGLAMTAYGSCATPSASTCQGSIYTEIQWID